MRPGWRSRASCAAAHRGRRASARRPTPAASRSRSSQLAQVRRQRAQPVVAERRERRHQRARLAVRSGCRSHASRIVEPAGRRGRRRGCSGWPRGSGRARSRPSARGAADGVAPPQPLRRSAAAPCRAGSLAGAAASALCAASQPVEGGGRHHDHRRTPSARARCRSTPRTRLGKSPRRVGSSVRWVVRPGIMSTLPASDGTQNAWMTLSLASSTSTRCPSGRRSSLASSTDAVGGVRVVHPPPPLLAGDADPQDPLLRRSAAHRPGRPAAAGHCRRARPAAPSAAPRRRRDEALFDLRFDRAARRPQAIQQEADRGQPDHRRADRHPPEEIGDHRRVAAGRVERRSRCRPAGRGAGGHERQGRHQARSAEESTPGTDQDHCQPLRPSGPSPSAVDGARPANYEHRR